MAISTLQKEMDILNETGKHLLELKKVLVQNKHNPLIYNGLLSSLNTTDYEGAVYTKLINDTISAETFENILITYDSYTNTSILKKIYSDFQKKLDKALEKEGQKYFTTESSIKEGVIIVRRFGINLEFIKREFKLTDKEARKLLRDGFVEKYAQLKLNAIMKDMLTHAKKQLKMDTNIQLDTAPFYYNATHEVYNIDFRIIISVAPHYLNANTIVMNRLVKNMDEILKSIQKEYYKGIHVNS